MSSSISMSSLGVPMRWVVMGPKLLIPGESEEERSRQRLELALQHGVITNFYDLIVACKLGVKASICGCAHDQRLASVVKVFQSESLFDAVSDDDFCQFEEIRQSLPEMSFTRRVIVELPLRHTKQVV